jgi:hypothetical protein
MSLKHRVNIGVDDVKTGLCESSIIISFALKGTVVSAGDITANELAVNFGSDSRVVFVGNFRIVSDADVVGVVHVVVVDDDDFFDVDVFVDDDVFFHNDVVDERTSPRRPDGQDEGDESQPAEDPDWHDGQASFVVGLQIFNLKSRSWSACFTVLVTI